MKDALKDMSLTVKVVEPSGILDSTKANQFEQEISEIIEAGTDIVLVDLKDVTFMDSSGLRVLVSAFKTVQAAKSQLAVCSVNHQVRMLFELASVDRFLDIFANREEFSNSLVSSDSSC